MTAHSEEVTRTASRKRLRFPNFCVAGRKLRKTDHANVSVFRTFAHFVESLKNTISQTFAFLQLSQISAEIWKSAEKRITETFRFSELSGKSAEVWNPRSRKRLPFSRFLRFGVV